MPTNPHKSASDKPHAADTGSKPTPAFAEFPGFVPSPGYQQPFIFVNGKKFDLDSGVKREMNYVEIAALDGITERQVVRRFIDGNEPPLRDVKADETVTIEPGMKFMAERKPEPVPVGPVPTPVVVVPAEKAGVPFDPAAATAKTHKTEAHATGKKH